MSSLLRDLKYALRGIGRRPGHTALIVLTLALGLGVNTVAFSSVNALLFRPFHITNADQYGWVFAGRPPASFGNVSREMFETLRAKASTLETLVAEGRAPLEATTPAGSEQVWGLAVSEDYFSVVQAPIVIGRPLSPTDVPDNGVPILVSERYWRTRWNAAADLTSIRPVINGQVASVIGVVADTFEGPGGIFEPHLWFPLDAGRLLQLSTTPTDEWLTMMARPRAGATPAQIGAEVQALVAGIDSAQSLNDAPNRERRARYVPIIDGHPEARALGTAAALGMSAVGLVLLIACFNVAGLILARSAERQRELGLRTALGASRLRLSRQLLVEGLVLAAIAGGAALLLAQWSESLLGTLSLPAPIPQRLHFSMDWRMVAFTAALVLVAATVPVLAPAWQVFRGDPIRWLKAATAGSGPSAAPGRRAFVFLQVVGSTMFLALALMFVTSYVATSRTEPGFNTSHVALMQIAPGGPDSSPDRQRTLVTDLVARLERMPDIAGVSLAERLSSQIGTSQQHLLSTDGRDCAGGGCVAATSSGVTSAYFETMEIPLRAGRVFDHTRGADTDTAVISEAAADALWPGESPIGRWVHIDQDERPSQVIGVVADVASFRADRPREPYLYRPLAPSQLSAPITVVARSRVNGDTAASSLRTTWRELENAPGGATTATTAARSPVFVQTMEDQLALVLWPSRVGAAFFATCGTLAVLLVSLGLFGVTYFTVTQRTREFGIRLALGATALDLRRLVLGESLRLIAPGLALGLVAAAGLASLASAALVGVSALDPRWYVATVILQAGVSLLASWAPAQRAAHVSPQSTLRGD